MMRKHKYIAPESEIVLFVSAEHLTADLTQDDLLALGGVVDPVNPSAGDIDIGL